MKDKTKTRLLISALIVNLFFLTGTLGGCGKKMWPSPVAEQDTFAWDQVQGTRQDSCLNLQAKLKGAYINLQTVVLELEVREDPCPECPFSPTQKVLYPLSTPGIERLEKNIRISYCELEKDKYYRWRLIGQNRYDQLSDVLSEVQNLGLVD